MEGVDVKAPLIRHEFYKLFISIRYAIDWEQNVSGNRSRGLKKNLARFPRSLLKYKVYQQLQGARALEHCLTDSLYKHSSPLHGGSSVAKRTTYC